MELNPNRWHVKFYFWCLDIWDAFLETHTDRHRSNLCQYIRTIFVWMPLVFVMNIGFLLYVLYTLFYFPVTSFGVMGTVVGYLVIGFIVGSLLLYSFVKEKWAERRRERRLVAEQTTSTTPSNAVAEQEEKGPGFIEVIWLYLVATKQKVCPTIEFKTDHVQGGI